MMKIIKLILLLLLSLQLYSQTPVWNLDPTVYYVICTQGGKEVYLSYSDVQGNPAQSDLDMNNFSLINLSILTHTDNNSDGATWNTYEKGTTGEYWIQRSIVGSPDFKISPTGQVTFGGTSFPTATGAAGQVLKLTSAGVAGWGTDDTGTGGFAEEYFLATHSSTTTIAQDTWTDINWGTEIQKDASFTHAIPSQEITIATAGNYIISTQYVFTQGTTRSDVYLQILKKPSGGTFSRIPGGFESEGTVTFGANSQGIAGIGISEVPFTAAANDVIKVQVYVDNVGDWALNEGSITIKRVQ